MIVRVLGDKVRLRGTEVPRGESVNVPEHIAKRWIANGLAEVPAKETATKRPARSKAVKKD